ncbi:MAG: S8 family serine peptidase, partial [Flavobacteriaceae bacterium]|nr:S8 family serine peptidase [Flavobacteriaceae bacterium]
WGITRVGGGSYNGSATAWIIDSGIDLDHPDLNVDVARSASFLSRGDADDQNGHGTHVAGTVAAIDNAIGVVGVAPGATVVAVRVLDRRGSGSTSGVIAGVDYVAANAQNGDVANMSLGGGVSTTLDNAVIAAAASGVKFALAAGNESDDANNHSPARANHANIYTVSAMDSNDNFASFSNYGNPPIEFCAPGVSIASLWKSGGYNTISGTSMAAPHVCGLLLLGNVAKDGTVNNDPDGNADDIAHH